MECDLSQGKTVSHIRIECWLNAIDHFETDVLAFFVAIQPEHDDIRSSRFLLEEGRHAVIGRRFFFQCFTGEQLGLGGRGVKRTSTSPLTGSTLSQLLNRGTKSRPKTCPATEVMRKRAEGFD